MSWPAQTRLFYLKASKENETYPECYICLEPTCPRTGVNPCHHNHAPIHRDCLAKLCKSVLTQDVPFRCGVCRHELDILRVAQSLNVEIEPKVRWKKLRALPGLLIRTALTIIRWAHYMIIMHMFCRTCLTLATSTMLFIVSCVQ